MRARLVLGLAVALAAAGAAGAGGGAAPVRTMEKYVAPSAAFVLYRPKGWNVSESRTGELLHVLVTDPARRHRVALSTGPAPAGIDLAGAGRLFLDPLGQRYPDLAIRLARVSRDRTRAMLEGSFTDPAAGRVELRTWITLREGTLTQTSIFAPGGRLEEARPLLLTVASNIRVTKAPAAAPATVPPLAPRRLPDGSASFRAPRDWTVQPFGKGAFVASAPGGDAHFLVASAEVLAPGVAPGAALPHSPFLPPHRALEMLTSRARLGSAFRFLEVTPQRDLEEAVARAAPGTPARAETFLYEFLDARGRPSKGFSFGMSLGSRTGITWTMWHVSVMAEAASFDALVPAFAQMMASYRIDDAYARQYVARGLARVRELQRETAAKVAGNARSIHETMQAAYDERQRSQDYIDYQRTNVIRGQQDWISEMEGGAIHHTDAWGTKNTATGEFREGAPYDYLHFEGKNPRYDEQMQAVDSRELWERHIAR